MADLVGAEFPVLSDADTTVSRAYGLFDLLGDGVAAPATLIVQGDGTVAGGHVGENAGDRPTAESIVESLRALQEQQAAA